MGMNYYAVEKTYRYGRKELHIGKASAGWLFLFHSCEQFRTFPQFRKWMKENADGGKYQIYTEEGEAVSADELLNLIESKQKDPRDRGNPRNFEACMNIDGYRFMDGYFS